MPLPNPLPAPNSFLRARKTAFLLYLFIYALRFNPARSLTQAGSFFTSLFPLTPCPSFFLSMPSPRQHFPSITAGEKFLLHTPGGRRKRALLITALSGSLLSAFSSSSSPNLQLGSTCGSYELCKKRQLPLLPISGVCQNLKRSTLRDFRSERESERDLCHGSSLIKIFKYIFK